MHQEEKPKENITSGNSDGASENNNGIPENKSEEIIAVATAAVPEKSRDDTNSPEEPIFPEFSPSGYYHVNREDGTLTYMPTYGDEDVDKVVIKISNVATQDVTVQDGVTAEDIAAVTQEPKNAQPESTRKNTRKNTPEKHGASFFHRMKNGNLGIGKAPSSQTEANSPLTK